MNIIDLLLPRRCVFCRAIDKGGICALCQDKLPWRVPPDQNGITAPLYYKDIARYALHRYKFKGFSGYAQVFGILMAQALSDSGAEADVVTWIPCGFWRGWSRGYDQSRLLALNAAKRLGLPAEKLLVKARFVKSQTKMANDGARRRNVSGVFKARGQASGKRVLLIDDIYTSGATMREAAAVLTASGFAAVIPCAVAAR
jgi:ComF family protein